MPKTWNSVTEALRECLIQTGWTYQRMADETGLNKAALLRFVQSRQSLRLDKADELVAFFGLRVSNAKPRRPVKKGG